MIMPTKRRIYAIGCPGELIVSMQEMAKEICDIRDAEWNVSDIPTNEMRGYCIILFGSAYLPAISQWTSDTAVLWIAELPDLSVLRQGFVDTLALPLDRERFAASFSNMVCRCDLKRRLDIRENELKTFFEISDDMLWTKNTADQHMDVNHVLINLAGKPREQIEGKHENEVYGLKPDAAGCRQSDFVVRTTGRMDHFEESMPDAEGKLHHLRVTKIPWLDGQGRIVGTIGLAKDISDLMNQQTKFERFLDNLELGVAIVNNDGIVLQANKVYLQIAGSTVEKIVGHKIKELRFKKSGEFGAEDYIIPGADGKETIWTCIKFDLKDYWGAQYGRTYAFRDVTQERKQEKKIRMMAVKDPLTGLPNRMGMYEYFDAMDKRGNATFLFIDIDNFKMVNDSFGHNTGDHLLRCVAGLFRKVLPDAFTARIGGDEFVSVVNGSVGRPELEKMTKLLLKSIKRLPNYPAELLNAISFSVGILYQYPLKDSLNSIVCKSDEGMYQAKWTGKNKFCFYDPDEFHKLQREHKRI